MIKIKNVLFIIDDIDILNRKRDTSILLVENAEKACNKIYFCYGKDIFLKNETPLCQATSFSIKNRLEKKYKVLNNKTLFQLKDFDIIFIRLNPPFNLSYLTVVHILNLVDQTKTLIINNPKAFQITSEKLIPLNFPKFIKETTITADIKVAEEFYRDVGEVVIKPLYSFSSDDVFLIKKQDCNFKLIFNILLQKYENCPIIIQGFISGVKKGDKRILIIDDKVLGSFLRVPKEDSILSGSVHGSSLILSELNEREVELISHVIEFMKQNKIYFTGIDIIDSYLTEVNFTSPTGIPILMELSDVDYGKISWDLFEKLYDKEIINE